MKTLPVIFILLLPAASVMAEDSPEMNQADMQRMMQSMREAQACMRGIDQSRMDAFRQRAEQVESEINALCAKGERDAAQSRGLAFAGEVNTDPDIRKMRECGEKMRGMMPVMPYMPDAAAAGSSGKHICDE